MSAYRPGARGWAWALAGLLLLVGTPTPAFGHTPVQHFARAEAVPSGWQAKRPPTTGWVPVTLPDDWSHRWPHHDGVVWYRIQWDERQPLRPMALMLNQVTLADAVYVNGSLIRRDAHLVEPLSRSWVKPQYFLIDAPVLRPGRNTLLIRVSGLADYRPGLGRVLLGPPQAVRRVYRTESLVRYRLRLYNEAIALAMAIVFGVLWLFRRRDGIYGWFALSALCTAGWAWNNVALNAWPFPSTDAFQAWNMVFYIAATVALAVFLLRYCERRWRWVEGVLWLYVAATALVALLDPHLLGAYRPQLAALAVVLYFAVPLVFIVHAMRRRTPDRIVLSVCLLIPLLVDVHDVLRFFEMIHDQAYVSALTAPFTLIGISFVLAWRYTAARRKAESFNAELQHEVEVATAALVDTLDRQRALEVAHSRVKARLDLVRDLHDGFGGSLVAAIAALEYDPDAAGNLRSIETLKELRDDLRLVIDTTTHALDGDLATLLGGLLRRWDLRFAAARMTTDFRVDALEGLHWPPSRSLDLLRFVQEALANALKHSRAACVSVRAQSTDGKLRIEVHDAGAGFDVSSCAACGAGIASLRARALRLGGEFTLDANPAAGTTLCLDVPAHAGNLSTANFATLPIDDVRATDG